MSGINIGAGAKSSGGGATAKVWNTYLVVEVSSSATDLSITRDANTSNWRRGIKIWQ